MRARSTGVFKYVDKLEVGDTVCVNALGTFNDHLLVEVVVTEVSGSFAWAVDPIGQTYLFTKQDFHGWTCAGGSSISPRGVAMRLIKEVLCPELPLDDLDKQREFLNKRPILIEKIDAAEKMVTDAIKRHRP